jgi:hypothetical protein
MKTSRRRKLKVRTEDGRHFVSAPSDRAEPLRSYLRGHGIQSSPPSPYLTGEDSIELDGKVDVKRIQDLLDGWGK